MQSSAGAAGYDLFVVEFEEHTGTTLVPVEAGEAAGGRIDPRWLPLAPRRIRRARAVSLDRATERAGATRVRQAIATAEQRRRRPRPDERRLATAARIVEILDSLGKTADASIAIGASSPRTAIPESAPGEDHHVLLRIESGKTTVKVTAAPESPSEPTVIHGGRLWDVSIPGFYHNALRLAGEASGRRPPALALETLVQLSTQLDAMRFAARFDNGGDGREEQITLEGLADQLLLRCWPVVTAADPRDAWTIPVASAFGKRHDAATATLERNTNRVRVTDGGIERRSAEAAALDLVVSHLTAAAKLRAHPRWADARTRYVTTARRNRRTAR